MRIKISKTHVMLGILVVIGLFLRLYRLGTPSLARDELSTAFRVGHSYLEIIRNLAATPLFSPLYYLLAKFWAQVFGNSECSLRFPSAVFSALTIPLIYKLGKELFDRHAGIVAALLLTFSPYAINYAQEAKMYSMLWFFSAASFLFFARMMMADKKSMYWPYIIATTLSIYTMYIGFLFMIVQNVLFFFLFFDKKKIRNWIKGQGIVILLYLPWMYNFLIQTVHKYDFYQGKEINSYSHFFKQVFVLVTGCAIGSTSRIELFLYIFLFCLAGIEVLIMFSRYGMKRLPLAAKNYGFLFLWILVPAFVYGLMHSLNINMLQYRYWGFMHIPLILLFSAEINKIKIPLIAAILSYLIVATMIFHLYPYYKYGLKITRENWRGLCADIDKNAQKNDLIFFLNGETAWIKYYLRSPNVFSEYRPDPALSRRVQVEGAGNSIFVIYKFKKFAESFKSNPPAEYFDGFRLQSDHSYGDIGVLQFQRENESEARLTSRPFFREDDSVQWDFSDGHLNGEIKIAIPDQGVFQGQCRDGFENCTGVVVQKNGFSKKAKMTELIRH